MILHIFPTANYTVVESYTKFLKTYFNLEDHKIVIVTDKTELPALIENNNYIHSIKFEYILKNYSKYSMIIFHSLYSISTLNRIKLKINKKILEKIVWVAWGGDLYHWDKSKGHFFKDYVRKNVNLKLIKGVTKFVGIFPPDILFYEKHFGLKSETMYASYTGAIFDSFYEDKRSGNKPISRDNSSVQSINILLGHQADPCLNHIDVLQALEKFRGENIQIYLPLSYGDKKYGDEVESYALNIFGKKLICMRKFIPKAEYLDMLSNIDIAIFNTDRQIGLGNINPLLFSQKKIYMKPNTVMYDYYIENDINISDYDQMKRENFDDFKKTIDMNGAHDYIVKNELDIDKKIEMWNRVFKLH